MNGDQEPEIPGNQNRFHIDASTASDEDYEDVDDVGSGVEDDAPESFQALNRSEPPWATFPDLLRVPTSTANNAAAEDDSPESLSFAAQPFRSNDLTNQSGYRSVTANPLNQLPSVSSTSSNHVPFVGGIPKNRLSHPDVFHVDQSNSICASSRNFHNSQCSSSRQGPGSFVDPSGAASSSTNPRPLPALPVNSQHYNSSSLPHPRSSINGRHHQTCSSDNDYGNRIAHRNPINSLNLSSALYSSTSSSSLSHSLTPITTALTRVQSSVDALSRQVNERLDFLENRLNNLTAFSSSLTSTDKSLVNSSDPDLNHNCLREMSPESLKSFISEQRKEMHNERRAFLLSFADALRDAAESSNRPSSSKSDPSTSGLNGL